MDFLYNVPADATSAGGLGKVRSRWQWSGAGRSDVTVTTTDSTLDLHAERVLGHQLRQHLQVGAALDRARRTTTAAKPTCAFPTAEYSTL